MAMQIDPAALTRVVAEEANYGVQALITRATELRVNLDGTRQQLAALRKSWDDPAALQNRLDELVPQEKDDDNAGD